MRRYKVLRSVFHTADDTYAQNEEFEAEFSAEDEATNLNSGLLELQPLKYKVAGGSVVHGHKPGEEFELALGLGEEALLIEGGHLERVEEKTPPQKRQTKKKGG